MTDTQSNSQFYFSVLYVVSVQAFTSQQIRVRVQSVTAIRWEHHSVVVRAIADSVSVHIPQWEGDAVTSVLRCFSGSTPAWAGNSQKRTDEHHICRL